MNNYPPLHITLKDNKTHQPEKATIYVRVLHIPTFEFDVTPPLHAVSLFILEHKYFLLKII